MNTLYPLKFKPIFKDKIWGGQKIRTVLGKDFSPLPNCGEVWVISGVEGSETKVENGFLAGNELNELAEVYMFDLVGDKVYEKHGNEFPLLIKFIDAKDWLSIQVHPDDALARKRKLGNGKSEMWYIIGADEDSQLISGFNKKITQHTYLQHLENGTLKDIMNFEHVDPGDVFYMPAGRVHALGPGVLLAEIQQSSDTTYRIYDWDRTDDQGNSRKLHTGEALEAIDYDVHDDYKSHYSDQLNETCPVVKSPYFTTNILEFDTRLKKDFTDLDSFVIYICVEGSMHIHYPGGEPVKIELGDAALIPAMLDVIELQPLNKSKLLEVYVG